MNACKPAPILIWLVLLIAGPARGVMAQVDLVPRIRSFTSSDYGAEAQNWDLTQGAGGRIYVANSGGLLVFDGLHWTTYQLPGQPTVRAVAANKDRLYVGGYGEFGYLSGIAEGRVEYVSLSDQLPETERNEEIWHIECGEDGTVYFQSFGRLYALQNDEFTRIELPGGIMFTKASGSDLLVPVTGEGLYTRRTDGTFTRLPAAGALAEARIMGVIPRERDTIVASLNSILKLGATLETWSERANALLAGQQINRLIELSDGGIAVGTILSGVYFFDANGSLTDHLHRGNGLSNNTVLSLFEDRTGNVWVGLDRGLDLIVRSEPVRYYSQEQRAIGTVYAAARYGGCTYLGSNQGLFRACDSDFQLVDRTAGQVWELRVTDWGLLCGHNEGTFLINEQGVASKISDRSGGWQTIPVPGREGHFLQANYTGLSLIDVTDPGRYDGGAEEKLEGLAAPLRYLAATGPAEVVSIHGSRGAFRIRLSPDWNKIESIDTIHQPVLTRALLSKFDETLLVQARDGNYRYTEGELGLLTHFRGRRIATGQYCLPGAPGTDEWFMTTDERVIFLRDTAVFASFPVKLRTDSPLIVPWTEGGYLLSTEDGFAIYRPNERPPAPATPLEMQIATLRTDGWRALPRSGMTPELPYAENNVRFEYALVSFDRPIRYRHRLLGFNDRWSEWTERGEREYTNLPEGNYQFQLEANWFGGSNSFDFVVLPPWYRKPWAYLFYGLVAMTFLYLLYRWHRRRLSHQARQLETVRQRQLQRQRILSKNQQLEADVDRKNRELANTTLTLAKKNEILLELKEELAKVSAPGSTKQSFHKLLHLIDRNLNNEEDWAIFESHFNEVHEVFLKQLRHSHPDLTAGELQLAAYLRMDLSSKEIAPLLHISTRGVENKRYRLRKKMGLESSDNLNQYLQDI